MQLYCRKMERTISSAFNMLVFGWFVRFVLPWMARNDCGRQIEVLYSDLYKIYFFSYGKQETVLEDCPMESSGNRQGQGHKVVGCGWSV